jgi:hypothetical protein
MTPEVAGYQFVLACIGLLCVQGILLLMMMESVDRRRKVRRRPRPGRKP